MSYIKLDLGPSWKRLERCRQETVRDGSKLFEVFHRFKPFHVAHSGCDRVIPEVLVKVGRLKAVIYSSDRGQRGTPRTFIHFMKTPPTLACDVAGRQLYIIGGGYRIGGQGIEG